MLSRGRLDALFGRIFFCHCSLSCGAIRSGVRDLASRHHLICELGPVKRSSALRDPGQASTVGPWHPCSTRTWNQNTTLQVPSNTAASLGGPTDTAGTAISWRLADGLVRMMDTAASCGLLWRLMEGGFRELIFHSSRLKHMLHLCLLDHVCYAWYQSAWVMLFLYPSSIPLFR